MMLNFEQVKGIAERLFTVGVTYAVGRGWIPAGDAALYVAFGLAALSAIWGWKVNTKPALEDAAKSVKKAEK